MTREEFYLAAGFFLDAHGVENFRAHEIAPVGRRAVRDGVLGPPLQAPPAELMPNALRLIDEVLEWVRWKGGPAAVHVSSWYRDPAYNAFIRGAGSSMHLLAAAADIRKDGMSPRDLALLIHREHPHTAKLGIGLYPTFVHVDVRGYLAKPAPARWGVPGWWQAAA